MARASTTAPPKPAEIDVQAPGVGRIVHFTIAEGETRPAVVITYDELGEGKWFSTVLVLLSPSDVPFAPDTRMYLTDLGCFVTINEINHGEQVGQWRWPLRT